MNPQIYIEITPEMVASNLTREEILEFIRRLDLYEAEWDFTVKLVKNLIASLEEDESREFVAEELGFKV